MITNTQIAEEIFENFAKKNFHQWNQRSFKRSYRQLNKAIIDSISKSLDDSDKFKDFAKYVAEWSSFDEHPIGKKAKALLDEQKNS